MAPLKKVQPKKTSMTAGRAKGLASTQAQWNKLHPGETAAQNKKSYAKQVAPGQKKATAKPMPKMGVPKPTKATSLTKGAVAGGMGATKSSKNRGGGVTKTSAASSMKMPRASKKQSGGYY